MTAPTDEASLSIPRGELLRSRVVANVGETLEAVLDRELTGYATLVPQETLLSAGDARGVLTFEAGVPVLAYNTATDRGGSAALASIAVPGPYRVELYAVARSKLAAAHDATALQVPPDAPATELADDPALAARTRDAAPADRQPDRNGGGGGDGDAVAAFLADDDRIEAIRTQAREEARARAAEWGLNEALSKPDGAAERGDTADLDDAADTAEPDGF
jgi:hypothetical protein